MPQRFCLAIVLLLVMSVARPALGWGNKEHIQLTRLSAMRLIDDDETPPAMKDWLRANTPGLTDMARERDYFMTRRIGLYPREPDGIPWWATVPDLAANSDHPEKKIEPFGVHERLLHYLDVELVHPDESKRAYRHDLSGKPRLEEVPRDISDDQYKLAGMLPFRVQQSYDELVRSIRAGRLSDKPGQYPRDEHAAKWAGFLAHYTQDNTQPHHATIDYKSASYFADRRSAPNVHSEMEWRMADDEFQDYMDLRAEFWDAFVAALADVEDDVQTDDVWLGSVQTTLNSYDALPLIGLAAMHAAGQGGTPDAPQGRPTRDGISTQDFFRYTGPLRGEQMSVLDMKARQQAIAVDRVAKLWRQAWREATGE